MAKKRVKGVSALRRSLRRLPMETRESLKEAFRDSGEQLRRAIAAAAPKEHGDLSKAVHSKVSNDGLAVTVGFSQTAAGFKRKWKKGGFVALFQEFGTRHHKRQPFISPTFKRLLPIMIRRINTEVDETLQRASRWGK